MTEALKARIRVAITDQTTADELIALLEAMAAANADLEARVAALEAV